jgi:hypothetical protein
MPRRILPAAVPARGPPGRPTPPAARPSGPARLVIPDGVAAPAGGTAVQDGEGVVPVVVPHGHDRAGLAPAASRPGSDPPPQRRGGG